MVGSGDLARLVGMIAVGAASAVSLGLWGCGEEFVGLPPTPAGGATTSASGGSGSGAGGSGAAAGTGGITSVGGTGQGGTADGGSFPGKCDEQPPPVGKASLSCALYFL